MPLSRRQFLKASLYSAVAAGTVGISSHTQTGAAMPEQIEIVPVELTLPRLAPAFDGYRMVQISDIHMGTGMNQDSLTDVVHLINAQQPDLVAITGDFVTHGDVRHYAPALIEPLSQLQARDGVVCVMGNHDFWTDAGMMREVVRASHITDVSNSHITLERDHSLLHIAGVDTIWYQQDRLDLVLESLPDSGAAVLLAHEPDFADTSAASGRFDLQISGHSHGGQVVIPFVGPPVTPRHGQKYVAGQYQVGSMIQYTNRGIGTAWPPVRFNCPPEITVFTLRAAGAA